MGRERKLVLEFLFRLDSGVDHSGWLAAGLVGGRPHAKRSGGDNLQTDRLWCKIGYLCAPALRRNSIG
jgi:hypothetical protein